MPKVKVVPVSRYKDCHCGLFATTAIPAGQPIVYEPPVLSLRNRPDPAALEKSHEEYFRTVADLSGVDFAKLKTLVLQHSYWLERAAELETFISPDSSAAERVQAFELLVLKMFRTHSFSYEPGDEADIYRVFNNLGFLNHSCKANAAFGWDDENNSMLLRAIQPIDEGVEIFISYLEDPFRPKAERHKALGWECKCEICASTNPAIEKQFVDLCASLDRVDQKRSTLGDITLPEDHRRAGAAQLAAIALNAGAPNDLQILVQRAGLFAGKLGIQHLRLASAFDLLSVVSLAWYLAHRTEFSDEERRKYLCLAAEAKAWEMGAKVFYCGFPAPQSRKAAMQLWYLTTAMPNHGEEVFIQAVEQVGLEAKVVDGVPSIDVRRE